MIAGLHGPSSPKAGLPIGILQLQLIYRPAGYCSFTENTEETIACQNSRKHAGREEKSVKRKELLSGSFMVYTTPIHAMSEKYSILMVLASMYSTKIRTALIYRFFYFVYCT